MDWRRGRNLIDVLIGRNVSTTTTTARPSLSCPLYRAESLVAPLHRCRAIKLEKLRNDTPAGAEAASIIVYGLPPAIAII